MDPIDYLVTVILLFFSMTYYHMTYLSFNYYRKVLDDWYFILKHPLSLIMLLYISDAFNDNGSKVLITKEVMWFYGFAVFVFMQFGNDVRYFMLGIAVSFFMSEYWEIPIYFWEARQGKFGLMSAQSIIYTVGRIIVKLTTLRYVLIELKNLGLDPKDFINELYIWSFVYFGFVCYWLQTTSSSSMNWVFRISCFIMVFQYLYKKGIIMLRW